MESEAPTSRDAHHEKDATATEDDANLQNDDPEIIKPGANIIIHERDDKYCFVKLGKKAYVSSYQYWKFFSSRGAFADPGHILKLLPPNFPT